MKTAMDKAIEKVDKQLAEKAIAQNKAKPLLDRQLRAVEKADGLIKWYENKIKEAEEDKQKELMKMNDLLEMAEKSTHELKNGYKVKPDNKYYIQIKDVGAFMSWLKKNKTPDEVFEFFKDSIGKRALKKFCSKEINHQKECGIIEPVIDGIDFGDITYRRLTTTRRKK